MIHCKFFHVTTEASLVYIKVLNLSVIPTQMIRAGNMASGRIGAIVETFSGMATDERGITLRPPSRSTAQRHVRRAWRFKFIIEVCAGVLYVCGCVLGYMRTRSSYKPIITHL